MNGLEALELLRNGLMLHNDIDQDRCDKAENIIKKDLEKLQAIESADVSEGEFKHYNTKYGDKYSIEFEEDEEGIQWVSRYIYYYIKNLYQKASALEESIRECFLDDTKASTGDEERVRAYFKIKALLGGE